MRKILSQKKMRKKNKLKRAFTANLYIKRRQETVWHSVKKKAKGEQERRMKEKRGSI